MEAVNKLITLGKQAVIECKNKVDNFVKENPTTAKVAKYALIAFAAATVAFSSPILFVAGLAVGLVAHKEVNGIFAKMEGFWAGKKTAPLTRNEKIAAGCFIATGLLFRTFAFGGLVLGAYIGAKWQLHQQYVETNLKKAQNFV